MWTIFIFDTLLGRKETTATAANVNRLDSMLTRAAYCLTLPRHVVCGLVRNNPQPPAFSDMPQLFHSVRFTIAGSVSVFETLNDMHGNVSPPMLIGSRSFVPDSVNQIV